jgi:hypothetical protein
LPRKSPFYNPGDIIKCDYGKVIDDDYYMVLEFDKVDSVLDVAREVWYSLDLRTGSKTYISFHVDQDMVVA